MSIIIYELSKYPEEVTREALKDMRLSRIHQSIYRKARMEQNEQMNKSAHNKSLFAKVCRSEILKYGNRSGFVVIGREDEKFFQVSPFSKLEYGIEIPAFYTKDPVEFVLL